MKIPRLFKTKTITIETDEGPMDFKIKGYRGTDYDFVTNLDKVANKINTLITKLNRIGTETKEKDDEGNPIKEFTDEEIDELKELSHKVSDYKKEAREYNHILAQRGIKRTLFPETTSTEEIDEIEDVELDDPDVLQIVNAMAELSQPRRAVDKGKRKSGKKEPLKKKSKASGK